MDQFTNWLVSVLGKNGVLCFWLLALLLCFYLLPEIETKNCHYCFRDLPLNQFKEDHGSTCWYCKLVKRVKDPSDKLTQDELPPIPHGYPRTVLAQRVRIRVSPQIRRIC